jgi:predicted trehalose synthase
VDLEALISVDEPDELSSCSMPELRAVRDAYQQVENGLSYARRMIQGRLDIVSIELERRDGSSGGDLVGQLSSALANNTRGPGMPRPPQDLEPPAWANTIVEELDTVVGPADLARLDSMDEASLASVAERIGALEQQVSSARRDVHGRIDRIQDELIGRYRDGASVDDLLP